MGGRGSAISDSRQRGQDDLELGALAWPFTSRRHAAVVHFHQALDQRQPEAKAALGAVEGPVRLGEGLKQVRQDICTDPSPGVANPNGCLAIPTALDRNSGGAALGRELHRVLQQVADHLNQAGPVGVNHQPGAAGPQRKLHAGSCKQVAVVLDRPADQLVEVHPLLFKPDLAARDPRDVEEIVDQTGQVRNLALDHRFSTLHLLAIAANMLKDVQAVLDGRQRVAQLVGEHRQKLILARVRVAQFALAFLQGMFGFATLALGFDGIQRVRDIGCQMPAAARPAPSRRRPVAANTE